MQPQRVDQQADRPAPGQRAGRPAGQDRTDERILDGDDRRAAAGGDGAAAPCGRAVTPDADRLARAGQARNGRPAGQAQDTRDARRAEKAGVENAKPPGGGPGGCVGGGRPAAQFAIASSVRAWLAVPMTAPMVFCHCT